MQQDMKNGILRHINESNCRLSDGELYSVSLADWLTETAYHFIICVLDKTFDHTNLLYTFSDKFTIEKQMLW